MAFVATLNELSGGATPERIEAGAAGGAQSRPRSITCDVGEFVYSQLPTMTDVEVVARTPRGTIAATARYGSRTWDQTEPVVDVEFSPPGVFELLRPLGPVSLACVSVPIVHTATTARPQLFDAPERTAAEG